MNDVPDGFKMTELGPLPEEWKVVNLGDVFEFSRKPRGILKDNAEVPFIPMEHISDNSSRINGWQLKNVSEISSGTFVLRNDLVIAKITPSFENGKQAVLDNLPEAYGYATTEIWAIHPKNQTVIVEYLYNYLKMPPIRADLASKMEGSTGRQRLPRHVLQNLQFSLPPLPEQHAIARMLSTVQEAREKTEAAIDATRELKKSLMKHLYTYGPVPLQDADKVPLKETEIGLVPERWEIASLEQHATVQTGIAKGRKLEGEDTIKVPYLRVANVQDGYLDLSEMKYIEVRPSEMNRYSLQHNDVVVTEGGDFDKLGRGFIWHGEIPCCVHQNHIFAVRTKHDALIPEYLAYLIQSEYGKSFFLTVAHRTTHLACINSKKLKGFPVLLPDIKEQKRIAHTLNSVDHKIQALENKKNAIDALFQTLLQNLVTAKIRVNHMGAETCGN